MILRRAGGSRQRTPTAGRQCEAQPPAFVHPAMQVKVTRPTFQYEKPNRSESQQLADGAIDLASLLPSNPPGAAASQRAEAKVVSALAGGGGVLS